MTERGQIEDRAAHWLMRREDASWDGASQAEFDAWLESSMAHKAAYWRQERGWREADRIVAIAPPPPRRASLSRFVPHGAWRPVVSTALAAALVAALFLPSVLTGPDAPVTGSYRTAIGQARTVTTPDGSRIELNTGTVLRTEVASNSRDAWLDRGEAFFDIHHEDDRPFRVHAGPKVITVLGTRFLVRRDGDKVTVAVTSGRISINDVEPAAPAATAAAAAAAAPRSATVAAGDVAVSAGSSMVLASNDAPRIAALTAWRTGMLVFDNTPLKDAVGELNRYTTKPIVIEDPEIARFRIGGSFRLSNSQGFLRLLGTGYGLKVDEDADTIRISR